MSTVHKHKLRELVSDTNNADDLIPILRKLPINKLKHVINSSIDVMDEPFAKQIHLNYLSINQIIPDDIIRHILSFQGLRLNPTKLVNKQWNKLSKQAEKHHYIYSTIIYYFD